MNPVSMTKATPRSRGQVPKDSSERLSNSRTTGATAVRPRKPKAGCHWTDRSHQSACTKCQKPLRPWNSVRGEHVAVEFPVAHAVAGQQRAEGGQEQADLPGQHPSPGPVRPKSGISTPYSFLTASTAAGPPGVRESAPSRTCPMAIFPPWRVNPMPAPSAGRLRPIYIRARGGCQCP